MAGLPPRFLTIRGTGDGATVDMPPQMDGDSDSPEYAAVRMDDAVTFANSVALDGLVNPVIVTSATEAFRFDPETHALTTADHRPWEMPARTQDVGP